MKKSFSVVGIISMVLVIGCFFTGCASAPQNLGVYRNTPEDQICTLEIAGGLQVVDFNGTKVAWAENATAGAWKAQSGGSKFKTTIKIPAGSHKLKADLVLWPYNDITRKSWVKGLEISSDFLPGHTYFLRPVIIQGGGFLGSGEDKEVLDYQGGISFKAARLKIEESGQMPNSED